MKKYAFLVFALILSEQTWAQKIDSVRTAQPVIGKSLFTTRNTRDFSRKGSIFGSWGYNFSWYNKSDIHFSGVGYDFTLKDVLAYQRPTKFSFYNYFRPVVLSVPEFDLRIGYFIKDNYSISIGWDHMKYVMRIPQNLVIDGFIGATISNPAIPTGAYAGVYHNQLLNVKADMLTFEHTDGFNYANTELERYDDIFVNRSKKTSLTLETGAGIGLMVPRSDVRLFTVGQNNYWNVAGYGASVKAGFKYYITRRFYVQNSTKLGWTNLKKIRTTGRDEYDTANQKISYMENYTVFGFMF